MKGFKDFLMRGNLVELAVAFIIGGAFAKVVEAFTAIILDIVGKVGGINSFSAASIAGINIGAFLTALLSFVIVSAVVYFGLVKPYEIYSAKVAAKAEAAPAVPTTEELLGDIRDLLAKKN